MIRGAGKSRGKLISRPGFTLIESLTVISILGVLASLVTFGVLQAQRQARDAIRKSDLTAIGVAFQARYEARTCTNDSDLRRYPGIVSTGAGLNGWLDVKDLMTYSDSCGAFTEFLAATPKDPRYNSTSPYRYNLSQLPAIGKHFRLTAKLEHDITTKDRTEYCRLSDVWQRTFAGQPYIGCDPISFVPQLGLYSSSIGGAPGGPGTDGTGTDGTGVNGVPDGTGVVPPDGVCTDSPGDPDCDNNNNGDPGNQGNGDDPARKYNYFIGQ